MDEYTLAVGGDQVAVSAQKPGKPTGTAVKATKEKRRQRTPHAVSVTATVRNDHSFPAAANLTLYRTNISVETRRVELAPNEERTITYIETVAEPGDHVYRLAGQMTTVTIEPSPTPTPASETTSTDEPGFGKGAALLGNVGLILLLARQQ